MNTSTKNSTLIDQQVIMLYEQSKPGIITSIIVILILAFYFDRLAPEHPYAWTTYNVIISSIITYGAVLTINRFNTLICSPILRGNILALLNLTIGLAWGVFLATDIDIENESRVFLSVFLVVAITVGAVPSLSPYVIAYIAYAVALASPLTIVLIMSESTTYSMIGALIPTILLVGYSLAHRLNNTLATSIQLRFENEALIHELTQQRNEAELSKKRAEASDIAKSKFLAAASHDLRQPLHALMLFTEALELKNRDKAEAHIITNIKNSINAMETLFNALLDISKLDAGIIHPKPEHFYLNDILLTRR